MGILSSLFGIGGSKPSTSTVVQQQNIPPELAPFIKEILGEAQTLYKAELDRGYDPYTGLTTAPFTPEEEAAQEGITGLVGTTTPFIEEALGIQREGAEKFTPEVAAEYMSPYQRAVTDIEKREAQTQFEKNIMPRFEAEAISAGGLSGLGTRAGVEAAELQRGQSQLLADIEAKGLQSAFQNAQQQFAQQKAREQQMAANIGRTGPALFQAGLAERGAQMGVGEQKRELAQSELDEAYFKFLEERGFPQRTLTDYSQMVYGSPLSKQPFGTTRTETGTPFVSSPGSQLMGLGLGGLNIYGMGGGFNPNPTGFGLGNIFPQRPAKSGGQVNSRGLSGLPVIRRADSGAIINSLTGTLLPFARSIAEHVPPVVQPPTSGELKQGLGKRFNRPFVKSVMDRLAAEKKAALTSRTTGREDIISDTLSEIEAKRGPYYDEAIKETEVVDIGGGVGEEIRKQRPEGETPIEYLTKVMGAAAETAGEQRAEGRKERARLKEKRIGEDVVQLEKGETRELEAADELSRVAIEEAATNASNLLELSGLAMKEQEAIQTQLKNVLTIRNLQYEPAKVLASLMTAIGSTISKKTGKGFPSFTSEWGKLTEWAAKDTTGVTLRKTVQPDGSTTTEYVGDNQEVLTNDSPAMRAFKRKEADALSKMLLEAYRVQQAGGDPKASMAKTVAEIVRGALPPIDITKIPQADLNLLRNKPTAANKKYFDSTYGMGAAKKVLGTP
jgi:hypothetical protein